jgi:predicted Zn-dependent protease with MMP-like domain
MKTPLLLPALALLLVACPSGSDWGAELTRPFGDTQATMFYADGVDPGLAGEVLDALVEANYNFYSGLPEQLDRVDGRLTLRLGNDNEDSMADVLAEGEASGVVSYMHGLARVVSEAVGGEPVDIVLCRETLDEVVYTVTWAGE